MKTTLNKFLLNALLLIPVVIGGCGDSPTPPESHAHAESGGVDQEGITFKEGKGLQIAPETGKFIGLRIEDVGEKRIKSIFKFNVQVYRTAREAQFASVEPAAAITALASGQVNRSDSAPLQKGQAVAIKKTNGGSFNGRVTEINSSFGTNTSRVEVILAIDDPKAQLAQGTLLSAVVPTGSEKSVTAVPKGALLRTAEGNFVYTVSGERFVRAPVKLGVANDEFVEITEGLYAGDQIVVHPPMTLWMAELQAIRGGQACADGH